jgi:glutathione S-transferase
MAELPALYVILGSHACRTGMLLLEHKGIAYRRVVLPTGLHPFAVRALGFASTREPLRNLDGRRPPMLATADRMGTVPALRIDGRRVKTNRAIARHLDAVRPDPPLFPADPAQRAAVEEAERWGDDELQMVARRIALAAALHGPDALADRADDGRLGPLLFHHTTVRRAGVELIRRFVFEADSNVEARLHAELPSMLDRIDTWIADGTLNGERLNAADYLIAPSLALLWYVLALRPQFAGRPALALVDRLLPAPDRGDSPLSPP